MPIRWDRLQFELSELPYKTDALEPQISKDTVKTHYDKHHRGYVDKLNESIKGTVYESKQMNPGNKDKLRSFINMLWGDLQKMPSETTERLFFYACQIWNHDFYWKCLTPDKSEPSKMMKIQFEEDFGSFDLFKEQFAEAVNRHLASGWTWLISDANSKLTIANTADGDVPFLWGDRPVLAFDAWEHAYYIDHRHDRIKHLNAYWKRVNWKFVEETYL